MSNNEKKIFTDNLPKKSSLVSWKHSEGFDVKFTYNGINGTVRIIKYENGFLYIKYLDKSLFKISTGNFINCKLGTLIGRENTECNFKYQIGETIVSKNINKTILKRYVEKDKNNRNIKKYIYHCNICGADDIIGTETTISKNKCTCCTNKVAKLGINTIWDTDKWMIPIINDDEFCKTHTHGCSDRIYPTCPDCGEISKESIKISNIYSYKKMTCKCCGDGVKFPNKFAFNLLEQLGLDFVTEYSPKWIGRKSYDFYIPSLNLILEMDGGFHNKDNKMNGQTKEESREIDDYKDKMAKEHGIDVIRIDCDYHTLVERVDFIKQNILNSGLNLIVDLNKIDWDKSEKFALSNRVREACDLWNTGDFTISELSKCMKISRVSPYLKIGNKYGWCDYNPHNEMRNTIISNANSNSKEVEIFKDGISLGIFKNAPEISKKSEALFGKFLYACEISRVCNNTKDQYKGFVFKYTKNNPNTSIKHKEGREINIFKDGILIGTYESCNELSRRSEQDFGVKLSISKISNVCNGKRPQHKGFTFRYSDNMYI